MADFPQQSSAEQFLSKVTAENAKRAQQDRIDSFKAAKAKNLVIPDLNPTDRAVARLQQHQAATRLRAEFQLKPPSENQDLRDRVARLENLLQLTLDSLNGATITCSSGSIVLTFPDLPT